MDWPRLTFGTRPTLALPEACCTQLAMRLGREPSSYPIRHARPVDWPRRISRVMSPVIRPSFELDVTRVKSADPEFAWRFHAFTPSWRPKSA